MSLLQSVRTEPTLRNPALAVVLLGVTAVLGELVLTTVFERVLEGSSAFPVWLPQFGTIGQTVLYYSLLLRFLELILIPVALMWLAYAFGRYTAVQTDN